MYAFPATGNLTEYRLLITSNAGSVTVKIYDALDAFIASHTISGVLSGDMTFLANPGRRVTLPTTYPWIGRMVFAWNATASEIAAIETAGTIVFPSISVPAVVDQPSFVEGVYSTWVSPSVGAAGGLSVQAGGDLPAGLTVGMQGGSLVIFGSPSSGSAGTYPISFVISDGLTTKSITVQLVISVGSRWAVDSGVTDDVVVFGDYYYQISGGPIRKEFTYPEGSL
jgi:hypothetical protein